MVLLGRNGLRPANPRPFAPCSRSPVVTRNTTAQPTAESNCGALSARFGAGTSNGAQPPEPPRVAKETQGQEASNPPCSGRFGAMRRICRAKKLSACRAAQGWRVGRKLGVRRGGWVSLEPGVKVVSVARTLPVK